MFKITVAQPESDAVQSQSVASCIAVRMLTGNRCSKTVTSHTL